MNFLLIFYFCSVTQAFLPKDCNLSKTDLFEKLPNGDYRLNKLFKLRAGSTNPTSGEKLHNKAKIRKANALIAHKKQGDYSDVWLSCANSRFDMTLIKCYNNGRFEINGRRGRKIKLPTCEKIGCNPTDLGVWNSRTYGIEDGCKKGYFQAGEEIRENDRNRCFRVCRDNVKSKRKIKCVCDYTSGSCSYMSNGGKGIGFVPWTALNEKGDSLIPTEECSSPESASTTVSTTGINASLGSTTAKTTKEASTIATTTTIPTK